MIKIIKYDDFLKQITKSIHNLWGEFFLVKIEIIYLKIKE